MVSKTIPPEESLEKSVFGASRVLREVSDELVGAWWEINVLCLFCYGNVGTNWNVNLCKDAAAGVLDVAWLNFKIGHWDIFDARVDSVFTVATKSLRHCPAKHDLDRS